MAYKTGKMKYATKFIVETLLALPLLLFVGIGIIADGVFNEDG